MRNTILTSLFAGITMAHITEIITILSGLAAITVGAIEAYKFIKSLKNENKK